TVAIDGPVATIAIVPPTRVTGGADLHWELGGVFSDLREDLDVRVVVLTGTGDEFYVLAPNAFYEEPANWAKRADPEGAWRTFTGILRVHQLMAEIEKPIVAMVNGDAEAFGSSLVFASDLIVAAEDARVVDIHLAMDEQPNGPGFGLVAGDGGASLVPLFTSPARAKEFLMLSEPWTGADLAARGIINRAVPHADLEQPVDELVARLLERSAYALAWTKRVVNRRVVDALNSTLDAGVAYEMVNFLQLARLGRDPMSLGQP
ncbi:MAG: enoyl-CoA hydratase/isomerase family protein, partial [Actinobacteria bacterium]|nr:enoyl-CoA hydratase/isomerase family protein [Actinomycetota bacterium]